MIHLDSQKTELNNQRETQTKESVYTEKGVKNLIHLKSSLLYFLKFNLIILIIVTEYP